MNKSAMRAPWEYSKAALALASVASNAAQNGAVIDRTGYVSAIVDIPYSCSGAPTGGLFTAQLQDSADGVTFANFGSAVTAAIPPAGGALASVQLDIAGARQFIRLTTVAAPTGGNAPVVTAAATARLYGPDRLPAL